MARKRETPRFGGRGARNLDLACQLIAPSNTPNITAVQAAFVARRFRLSPLLAAVIAQHAFGEARNV